MARIASARSPKKPSAPPAPARVARYTVNKAILARKVWILGCEEPRIVSAVAYLRKAGHDARGGEPGGDIGTALRTERPDLVVIDMAAEADRGKHVAVQLRADRGTRQLPIVLVGVASSEGPKLDRAVPGPTRRYAGALDSASVLEAIVKDL